MAHAFFPSRPLRFLLLARQSACLVGEKATCSGALCLVFCRGSESAVMQREADGPCVSIWSVRALRCRAQAVVLLRHKNAYWNRDGAVRPRP